MIVVFFMMMFWLQYADVVPLFLVVMVYLPAKAHLMAARERQAAAPDPASEAQPSDRQGRRGADVAGSDGHARGEKAHYLHDVKSSRAQMRRPSGDSSLSWR